MYKIRLAKEYLKKTTLKMDGFIFCAFLFFLVFGFSCASLSFAESAWRIFLGGACLVFCNVKCLGKMFRSLFCLLLNLQGSGLVPFLPAHQLPRQTCLSKQGRQHETGSVRGHRLKVSLFGVLIG